MRISPRRKQTLEKPSVKSNKPSKKMKESTLEKSKTNRIQEEVEAFKSSTPQEKTSHKKVKKKAMSLNVDKLLDEVFDQVDVIFALTSELQIPPDKAREIIKEIVENIASGYSSKPSSEAIVKKIKKNQNLFSELIAFKLLSEFSKLTPPQLEFAIARGGRAVLSEVGRLYRLALSLGRDDLISMLRFTWNTRGPKGMVECPTCGFNAISPDRNCIVCGGVVSEEYVRKTLGFSEKFELYLKTASLAELNEVLQLGHVLISEKGLYNPRSLRARSENQVLYTVYLRNDEISKIIEEMNSRDLPI